MLRAVIYDETDGTIVKQVFCRVEDVALNTSEGQSWLPYDGAAANKKVSQGQIVDIAAEDVVARELALAWPLARKRRDTLLRDSDWTQLPDVPLSEERRQQWETYRQALRDVTDQPDPFNIVWPAPPA